MRQHITSIEPTFEYDKDAVSARLPKFPVLAAELREHTRCGTYVWQYSRCPSTLPAVPKAGAAEPMAVALPLTGDAAKSPGPCAAAERPCGDTLPVHNLRSQQRVAPGGEEAAAGLQHTWMPAPVPVALLPPWLMDAAAGAEGNYAQYSQLLG